MKKSILTLCILQMGILVFGQDKNEVPAITQTPENVSSTTVGVSKRFGVTLQLNSPSNDDIHVGWFNVDNESVDNYNLKHQSFSAGLVLNYKIQNETMLRFRFGVTSISIIESQTPDYPGENVNKTTGMQTKLHFAPGIVWQLSRNKFSLYGGLEIPINLHGKYTLTQFVPIYSPNLMISKYVTTLPRGYSLGLGAILGFSYAPASWFSVGAEFSPSMLYAKLSGTTTINNPSNFTNVPYHTNDEDKGYTFYDQRFSINVSVWF